MNLDQLKKELQAKEEAIAALKRERANLKRAITMQTKHEQKMAQLMPPSDPPNPK